MSNPLDFQFSFWVDIKRNPQWSNPESDISFKPQNIRGIQVFMEKRKLEFYTYILHPEFGTRKLKTRIKDFINNNAHVLISNNEQSSGLFFNGILAAKLEQESYKFLVELKDYVVIDMNSIHVTGLEISQGASVIGIGKVLEMNEDISVQLFSMNNMIIKLPLDSIKNFA